MNVKVGRYRSTGIERSSELWRRTLRRLTDLLLCLDETSVQEVQRFCAAQDAVRLKKASLEFQVSEDLRVRVRSAH